MTAFETLGAAPLMGGMSGSGMGGGTGGEVVVFPLVALLTVATLLAVATVGARALTTDSGDGTAHRGGDATAIERLKRRYAAGELTEAEFERAVERELEREGPGDIGDADGSGDADGIDAESRVETSSGGRRRRCGRSTRGR